MECFLKEGGFGHLSPESNWCLEHCCYCNIYLFNYSRGIY